MNTSLRIFLSVVMVILGWLSIGIGFTASIGHPINTILFLLGVALFFAGIACIVLSLRKNN